MKGTAADVPRLLAALDNIGRRAKGDNFARMPPSETVEKSHENDFTEPAARRPQPVREPNTVQPPERGPRHYHLLWDEELEALRPVLRLVLEIFTSGMRGAFRSLSFGTSSTMRCRVTPGICSKETWIATLSIRSEPVSCCASATYRLPKSSRLFIYMKKAPIRPSPRIRRHHSRFTQPSTN